MNDSHREAKRLVKSIQRRRTLVQQLRAEAARVRNCAIALDDPTSDDVEHARRLDAWADRETTEANAEEKEHLLAANTGRSPVIPHRPDPDAAIRDERAMQALDREGSAARIRFLLGGFGKHRGADEGREASPKRQSPREMLEDVERTMDDAGLDLPERRAGMLFGERITNAERILHGITWGNPD